MCVCMGGRYMFLQGLHVFQDTPRRVLMKLALCADVKTIKGHTTVLQQVGYQGYLPGLSGFVEAIYIHMCLCMNAV